MRPAHPQRLGDGRTHVYITRSQPPVETRPIEGLELQVNTDDTIVADNDYTFGPGTPIGRGRYRIERGHTERQPVVWLRPAQPREDPRAACIAEPASQSWQLRTWSTKPETDTDPNGHPETLATIRAEAPDCELTPGTATIKLTGSPGFTLSLRSTERTKQRPNGEASAYITRAADGRIKIVLQ